MISHLNPGSSNTESRLDPSWEDLKGERGKTPMALFAGTYENRIDRKGRVSLPADFRAELPAEGARVVYVYPSPRGGALEAETWHVFATTLGTWACSNLTAI